ncbi:MAG: DUF4936 family protein [Rubrivivax sp.]|nr:MAG: DUF4936 family protein [Rubrivivax sp.]
MSTTALFIYYKLDAFQAKSYEPAVRQMQAALTRSHEGLVARLWVRPGTEQAPEQTWMETYEHPQGVDDGLAALIDQAAQGLPAGRLGERHAEVFVHV